MEFEIKERLLARQPTDAELQRSAAIDVTSLIDWILTRTAGPTNGSNPG